MEQDASFMISGDFTEHEGYRGSAVSLKYNPEHLGVLEMKPLFTNIKKRGLIKWTNTLFLPKMQLYLEYSSIKCYYVIV